MLERIWHMLIKEFIQVFRDPRMRIVIFVLPCMQMLIIGYAVSTDVRHVPTAVCDRDNSEDSRELIARFVGSGYFDLVATPQNDRELRALIDRGDTGAAICFDRGFADALRSGRTAAVQVILDGTDSNTAGIVLGYVQKITRDYSRKIVLNRYARIRGGAMLPGQANLQTRAWFNENLESRNFYVPGVVVIVVTVVTMLLTAMAVVREKEIGTMEQIMVTPITRTEFILGKTLPFAAMGFADVTVVATIATLWFGVPLRGSIALLYLATGLYLMSTLAVGLILSTISQTQQQAMMSAFFFLFPAILLSGFAFPIANMPEPVQWLTLANPLRYFLVILRGVFLKGTGVDILWPQLLALAGLGLAGLWTAVLRFHKTA